MEEKFQIQSHTGSYISQLIKELGHRSSRNRVNTEIFFYYSLIRKSQQRHLHPPNANISSKKNIVL